MREYETEKGRRGHIWVKDESGATDIFATKYGGYHNGPKCAVCGYGFCHHCHELPEIPCPGKSPKTKKRSE